MTDLNSLSVPSVVLILGISLLCLVTLVVGIGFGFWLFNTHGLIQLYVYLGILVVLFMTAIIASR